MPKSNAEVYEEAEAELYGRAFAESESEVFHDALALPEDDNDGDREFEEMESFDGEPLSLVGCRAGQWSSRAPGEGSPKGSLCEGFRMTAHRDVPKPS